MWYGTISVQVCLSWRKKDPRQQTETHQGLVAICHWGFVHQWLFPLWRELWCPGSFPHATNIVLEKVLWNNSFYPQLPTVEKMSHTVDTTTVSEQRDLPINQMCCLEKTWSTSWTLHRTAVKWISLQSKTITMQQFKSSTGNSTLWVLFSSFASGFEISNSPVPLGTPLK